MWCCPALACAASLRSRGACLDVAGASLRGRITPRSCVGGAARGTRPSGMTGCGQRPRETERAPDPEEINMPADNKQRVSLARRHEVARWPARHGRLPAPVSGGLRHRVPGGLRHGRNRCRGRKAGSHVSPQLRGRRAYSARAAYPCRIQPSRGSAAESGGRCWQSHQVPPGHFSWCCWRQDRQIMSLLSPLSPRHLRGTIGPPAGDAGNLPRQAAFARRIRRRRSADRSSSFSPPQVPYFSGRLTA